MVVLIYTGEGEALYREVKIQGAAQVAKEKIETAFGIGARTILDRAKVAEGVDKVRKLYGEQGYVNAAIDYRSPSRRVTKRSSRSMSTKGNRLLIKKISFEGNKAFSESDLKGLNCDQGRMDFFVYHQLAACSTRDMLTNDVAILSNHYNDNGYVEHKVDEPVILAWPRWARGGISSQRGTTISCRQGGDRGELIQDGKDMLKSVKLTTGQIFRGSRLREDVTSDNGYVFEQRIRVRSGRSDYQSKPE
jgi:outer membrane protein insertion porin family